MVEIQLNQMSTAKLTSKFKLQAYLGATITNPWESSVLNFVTNGWSERG